MATRSRRPLETLGALAALTLSACAPDAPPGVEKADLDDAVSRAIGDPNTCVLIAEHGGGDVVYRYNTATICARSHPACDGPGTTTVGDRAEAAATRGEAVQLSCNTTADASRGVGWASGPIPGKDLVYAAVMEGDRALPGRIMADRLGSAFERAGLVASE